MNSGLRTFKEFISDDLDNKHIWELTPDFYKVVPNCENTVSTSSQCYKYKCVYTKMRDSNISNICVSDSPFILDKYFKVLQYRNGISSEIEYVRMSIGNRYIKKYNGTIEKTSCIENDILTLYIPEKHPDYYWETDSSYIAQLRIRYNNSSHKITFIGQIIRAIQIILIFPYIFTVCCAKIYLDISIICIECIANIL